MKSNPFSTLFVLPGVLPWLASSQDTDCRAQFSQDASERFFSELQDRFAQFGRWGLIVGPHGTGKSTLLAHFVPRLGKIAYCQFAGSPQSDSVKVIPSGSVIWLSLRRNEKPLSSIFRSRAFWQAGNLMVIDGLEQLLEWQRMVLLAILQMKKVGLLATSHKPIRSLSILHETRCSFATVRLLAQKLISARDDLVLEERDELISDDSLRLLIEEEQGNVREVLMRLYDKFEDRFHDLRSAQNGKLVQT